MGQEKYVVNCPGCGRVEGFVSSVNGYDDEEDSPEAEMSIEQQDVRTSGGQSTRIRCPRCGRWLQPDRIRPA